MRSSNVIRDFIFLTEKSANFRVKLVFAIVLPLFILLIGAVFDRLANQHNPFIQSQYVVARVFAVLALAVFVACMHLVVVSYRKRGREISLG